MFGLSWVGTATFLKSTDKGWIVSAQLCGSAVFPLRQDLKLEGILHSKWELLRAKKQSLMFLVN